jgi:hypothetical protein
MVRIAVIQFKRVFNSSPDFNNATAIVKELNGLPLAIEQAGVLLGKNIVSFSDFIANYREHYRLLMDKYPVRGLLSYDKERSIMTVFDMLYSSIKKRSPEAAALLAFIAVLGPWQIPISLIIQLHFNGNEDYNPVDEDSKALRRALSDRIVLHLAFDCLADVCLVKLKDNRALSCQTFSLHRAICQWCVKVIASEKRDWMIQVAYGLAVSILDPTERHVKFVPPMLMFILYHHYNSLPRFLLEDLLWYIQAFHIFITNCILRGQVSVAFLSFLQKYKSILLHTYKTFC